MLLGKHRKKQKLMQRKLEQHKKLLKLRQRLMPPKPQTKPLETQKLLMSKGTEKVQPLLAQALMLEMQILGIQALELLTVKVLEVA